MGYLVPDNGHYRSHHALVRDVAYGRLSAPDRLRLHARYAREGVSSEALEILAHHWWAALGQPESEWVWRTDPELPSMRHNALGATLDSARQHSARTSFDRAVSLCERALVLASGPKESSEVHEVLASVYTVRGDGDGAWDEWLRALQGFKVEGIKPPARLYAEVVRIPTFNWGTLRTLPEASRVLALFEEGIQIAKDTNDSLAQARLLTQRAFFSRDVSDLPEMLKIVDSAPDATLFADLLAQVANVQLCVGEIGDAELTYRRMDRLVDAGATINEGEALLWRTLGAFMAGDLTGAGQFSQRLRAVSAKGSIHMKSHAMGTESLVRSGSGDWDEVRSVASEVKETVSRNPHLGFCLVGAAAAAWGSVAEILHGGSPDESLPKLVERMVPESAVLCANILFLPEAMTGRGEGRERAQGPYDESAALWGRQMWDIFGVNWILALTILERWDDLPQPLERCDRIARRGGRLAGALAESVREEEAAARGGPTPRHALLRELGYEGLSQLLFYRPRSG